MALHETCLVPDRLVWVATQQLAFFIKRKTIQWVKLCGGKSLVDVGGQRSEWADCLEKIETANDRITHGELKTLAGQLQVKCTQYIFSETKNYRLIGSGYKLGKNKERNKKVK